MTREEAKHWIENLILTMKEETSGLFPDVPYKDEVYEALDEAVKALEKEPILDKIRSEIKNLRNCSCSCSDGIIDDVEDIIDKYKAESEE